MLWVVAVMLLNVCVEPILLAGRVLFPLKNSYSIVFEPETKFAPSAVRVTEPSAYALSLSEVRYTLGGKVTDIDGVAAVEKSILKV